MQGLTRGLVARVTSLFAVAHFAQELLFALLSWHLPQPYCRQVKQVLEVILTYVSILYSTTVYIY